METPHLLVHFDTDEQFSHELVSDGVSLYIGSEPTPVGARALAIVQSDVCPFHAEINFDWDGNWTVTDLNSKSGTLVNGRMCVPGEKYKLKNGDLVSIGTCKLKVCLPVHASSIHSGDEDADDQFKCHTSSDLLQHLVPPQEPDIS